MFSTTQRRFAALCLLFFLSGGAFLGVEVVWARMLQRLVGSSSLAVAAVLAGFLGGMGAGGLVADRLRPRLARPLVAYAGAEFMAMGAALLLTLFLGEAGFVLRLPGGDGILILLVALASAPAGATFPLAAGALPVDERLAGRVRRLYGWNAAGGGLGALGAGLAGIPLAGEWTTVAICAGAQGLAASAAAILFRRLAIDAPSERDRESRVVPAAAAPAGAIDATAGVVALFLFLSGFLAFYWEVLWTRLLLLTVGATVYAFAVVSSSVLLGIGAGSLLSGGRLLARHGGWCLPLVVASLLGAGYFFVPSLPGAYLAGVRLFGFAPLLWGALGAGALAFLPNALLGGLFPWMVARRLHLAGRLYAANAAGSIAGAFLGGPLGATLFSLEDAYRLGIAGLLSLSLPGIWLARPCAPARFPRLAVPSIFGITLLLGATAFFFLRAGLLARPWDSRLLLSGVYAWTREELEKRSLAESSGSREILRAVRGREVIVSVEADRAVNTLYVRGNGKVEGSVPLEAGKRSFADLPTQVLLGELPVDLLHGLEGRRALLVGLGSGVTLGALLDGAAGTFAPGGIDVVEIEAAFLEAIRDPAVRVYLSPFVPGSVLGEEAGRGVAASVEPQGSPCRFHFGDARRLLATELHGRRWHVIVSQPSEPWIPGAASLFTVEFFEEAAEHLEEEGMFFQWLQVSRVELESLRLLVRTFRRAFPRVFLFRPPRTGELILIGSKALPDLERLLAAPAGRLFQATGLEVPADRLAAFLAGPRGVDGWVGLERGLPVNTDSKSEALYRLARSLHAERDPALENLAELRRLAGSDPIARYLPDSLRQNAAFLRLLAERNERLGDTEEANAILEGTR